MRVRNFWIGALGVVLAASLTACGGKKDDLDEGGAPAGAAAGGGPKVDAATAGNIDGVVSFDGVAPKNEPIKMNADPVCVKENATPQTQETYEVADGKLANVFVYVKDGLGNYSYDPPAGPVTIDQKGCRYHPHVFGIRVGQELDIVNSDPTLHNIHALPKGNAEFNTGQPIQGMKTVHTFTAKEVMVPFKCDVHGWMNAFVGVVDNPYFAVTGPDGKFSLKGLPPGTYTIEAWHEKAGTQTAMVTIGAKETKEANFTFKAPATATN
ncbi:MAG TPA: carboxypeptidase regulatory-like domain-containing protein [Vicinamibacterales bacterium]|nr:carboxypeptidase regulatory-like domain-containing protein [Vicinamibacterales bacterium]